MFGIAESVIIIAIVAFLFLLFRYGGRPVVMMVLGGLSLCFVAGLVLMLVFSHRVRGRAFYDPYQPEQTIVFESGGHSVGSDDWSRGERVVESRFVRVPPRSRDPWQRQGPWSRAMAEFETAVDPLVAEAVPESDGHSVGSDGHSVGEIAETGDDATNTAANNTERPAWIDQSAGKVGGGDYVATTYVGPFKTLSEAEEFLAIEVRNATDKHINRHIGKPGAAELVNLPPQYIDERIVTDTWQEKFNHSEFGPMMNLHARLRFDDAIHREIKNRHDDAVVASRLIGAGFGGGALFLLLTTVYGYLKLDTFTKGYYSGRLRVATAAMILSIVAAGGLLVQSVIWS